MNYLTNLKLKRYLNFCSNLMLKLINFFIFNIPNALFKRLIQSFCIGSSNLELACKVLTLNNFNLNCDYMD